MGEEAKVEVVLSAASPLTVKEAGELSPAKRDLILAAAGKIESADKAKADKVAADKIAKEQREQSRAGRKERQAAAGAK